MTPERSAHLSPPPIRLNQVLLVGRLRDVAYHPRAKPARLTARLALRRPGTQKHDAVHLLAFGAAAISLAAVPKASLLRVTGHLRASKIGPESRELAEVLVREFEDLKAPDSVEVTINAVHLVARLVSVERREAAEGRPASARLRLLTATPQGGGRTNREDVHSAFCAGGVADFLAGGEPGDLIEVSGQLRVRDAGASGSEFSDTYLLVLRVANLE